MHPALPTAQAGLSSIYAWSFLLILLVLGMFVAVWWVRRRAVGHDAGEGRPAGQPFTLSELRAMRQGGQIDDEQYERLKATIVGTARGPR